MVSAVPDSSPSPMLSRLSETLENLALIFQCMASSNALAATHNAHASTRPSMPGSVNAISVEPMLARLMARNVAPLAEGRSRCAMAARRCGSEVLEPMLIALPFKGSAQAKLHGLRSEMGRWQ